MNMGFVNAKKSDCYCQHVYIKAFNSIDQNIYQHFVMGNCDAT